MPLEITANGLVVAEASVTSPPAGRWADRAGAGAEGQQVRKGTPTYPRIPAEPGRSSRSSRRTRPRPRPAARARRPRRYLSLRSRAMRPSALRAVPADARRPGVGRADRPSPASAMAIESPPSAPNGWPPRHPALRVAIRAPAENVGMATITRIDPVWCSSRPVTMLRTSAPQARRRGRRGRRPAGARPRPMPPWRRPRGLTFIDSNVDYPTAPSRQGPLRQCRRRLWPGRTCASRWCRASSPTPSSCRRPRFQCPAGGATTYRAG